MKGRPRKTFHCSVVGCDRMHFGRGYCRPHYYRWRRNGDPGPAEIQAPRGRYGVPLDGLCVIEGCERDRHTRGYCNAHYLRTRSGKPLSDPVRQRAGQGAGSRWVNRNGYVVLTLPGEKGRIMEHRHVMQQALGRRLFADETVHHKNGIRDDNRLENLELWAKSQPSGQRVEDLLPWAREIIRRYGP